MKRTTIAGLRLEIQKLRREIKRVTKQQRGLIIFCDCCGEQIFKLGGLRFGPPNTKGMSKKEHICQQCWGPHRRPFRCGIRGVKLPRGVKYRIKRGAKIGRT